MNRKKIHKQRRGNYFGGDLPPFLRAILFLYEAEGYPAEVMLAKAREALRISEDCFAAHVILAEHAPTHEERIKWAREAVAAAGRIAANPDYAAYNTIEFSLRDNHLAVKNLLAQYLCESGEWEEAVPLLKDLIENEVDEAETDFRLLFALLITGEFEETEKFCAEYGEPYTDWLYSIALAQFGQHGDCELSRRALALALDENPLVPDYLLGRKKTAVQPVSDLQQYAEDYVIDFWPTWANTPGALEWLRRRTETKLTLVQ